jgi:hypothetical protein
MKASVLFIPIVGRIALSIGIAAGLGALLPVRSRRSTASGPST